MKKARRPSRSICHKCGGAVSLVSWTNRDCGAFNEPIVRHREYAHDENGCVECPHEPPYWPSDPAERAEAPRARVMLVGRLG